MDHATRRSFLYAAGLVALGAEFPARTAWALQEKRPGEAEEEVSPTEDLMREHGLLNRVLLIYEEAGRRLRARSELDPQVLAGAAGIIRRFIEEYHEKLEEDHLFPRFEKAGKLVELVRVLREQHVAGRRITSQIERLAAGKELQSAGAREQLQRALQAFIPMYRPHEAREDTVLFPALRGVVSPSEYDALGEQFEKKEHELFDEEGFERMVDEVAGLEKRPGIYELAQFTPH